jgi:hypothetical protein
VRSLEARTAAVQKNIDHPVWNETIKFDVSVPEMALVRFSVLDDKVRVSGLCQLDFHLIPLASSVRAIPWVCMLLRWTAWKLACELCHW